MVVNEDNEARLTTQLIKKQIGISFCEAKESEKKGRKNESVFCLSTSSATKQTRLFA
jgi:hypothetical protein